jgi:alpha-N-arabinofuranosidase
VSAAALLTGRLASLSRDADSHIEVLLDEPIATISPRIYGHFVEHIGGVIYDGVWVGKESSVANVQGIRKELIEKLKQIKVPVVRWPGGCFADSYDWMDGVGPNRPRRTNFWIDEFDKSHLDSKWVQMYDSNAFGTDEFIRLCKLTGAEPYLAANVRSLPALQLDRWVEYCNSPAGSTTLAEMRASAGSTEPYDVKLWGIGNESWGCGGDFTPQDYASEFRRYTSWVPQYGLPLEFIASGPSGNDLAWTKAFFEKMYSMGDHKIAGWSVHYYAWNLGRGKTSDWVAAKGDALKFDVADWYELFQQGFQIEEIIEGQWNAIGEFDEQHEIKLIMDEYGPWYRKGTEVSPESIMSQQVTLRDAVFTAFTLDTFNRHADKVGMAACAQLINCLNSLFLAHADRFVVTPNFYIFEMYSAHQGGTAVRTQFSSPLATYMRDGKSASFWGLNGSASLKGKILTVTIVNADATLPREAQIVLRGANVRDATAQVLSGADILAHNTFDYSQVSAPASSNVDYSGSLLRFIFPAASVTRLTVRVG